MHFLIHLVNCFVFPSTDNVPGVVFDADDTTVNKPVRTPTFLKLIFEEQPLPPAPNVEEHSRGKCVLISF